MSCGQIMPELPTRVNKSNSANHQEIYLIYEAVYYLI